MDNFNFKFVAKINVDSIEDKINQFTKEEWKEFDFRQKSYEVHRNTETIPLIFDKDFRLSNPSYLKTYKLFEHELNEIQEIFKHFYGKGFIIRALLVNLKANKQIEEHIDAGESLSICHRVHIPIITNEETIFTIANESKNLKKGEMWEINNCEKTHSVLNNSTQDRIHLIVDWIKNGS